MRGGRVLRGARGVCDSRDIQSVLCMHAVTDAGCIALLRIL